LKTLHRIVQYCRIIHVRGYEILLYFFNKYIIEST